MADLMQHVRAYLDSADSDYAIMIEGPWGCGKTFFWRTKIDEEVRSRKRARREHDVSLVNKGSMRETLQPIYVSLYGITRPDDIDRAVLLEINPWLGNKTLDQAGKFPRPLLKAFRFDPDSIKLNSKHWISLADVVLCFDDLERCNMRVSDVLGRINEYVEHEGVKTIILCNEGEIRRRNAKRYWLTKEKVVGRTMKFQIDHAAVLDALIQNCTDTGCFHGFLEENKSLILNLFRRSKWDNIRALKHALSHLRVAFLAIDENAAYAAGARKAMIGVILPLTFEHELGGLREKGVRDIATQNPLGNIAWAISNKGKPSPSKQHEMKYFDEGPEEYPASITVADLITTGLLDSATFKMEMAKAYAEPDELEAATRVLYGKIWNLSDDEFIRNTAVLWKAVASRSFMSLDSYFGLYLASHYWAKLGLVELDLDEIRERLSAAVRDSVARELVEYDDELNDHLPTISGQGNSEMIQFRDFIKGENAKLKWRDDERKATEFLQAIKDASGDGMRRLVSDFHDVPVLKGLPPQETADAIWALPNSLKSLFRVLVERRYLTELPSPAAMQEVEALQRLRDALLGRLSSHREKSRPLSHAAVEQIANDLGAAISRSVTTSPPIDQEAVQSGDNPG